MKKERKIVVLYNEVEALLSELLNKGLNPDETQELFLDLFEDQIKTRFFEIKKNSLKNKNEKDKHKKLETFFIITNEINFRQIQIKYLLFK